MRASMDDVPTTIYRPAIVVGDSQTGETQKFDGPYYLLRSMAGPTGSLLQIGRGDASFNVVPGRLRRRRRSRPARATPRPPATRCTSSTPSRSPRTSWRACSRVEYAGREPKIPLPPGVVDRSLRFGAVRKLFGGTPRESIVYLNHPVVFDTAQAGDVLGRNGLRCPRFPEYVGAMVRFFREHEADDAYRARARAA